MPSKWLSHYEKYQYLWEVAMHNLEREDFHTFLVYAYGAFSTGCTFDSVHGTLTDLLIELMDPKRPKVNASEAQN